MKKIMSPEQIDLINAIHINPDIIKGELNGSKADLNMIVLRLGEYLEKNEIFEILIKLRELQLGDSPDYYISAYYVNSGIIQLSTDKIVERIEKYVSYDTINNSKNTEAFTGLAIHEASSELETKLHELIVNVAYN